MDRLALGDFDVLEILGSGSFSTVFKAQPKKNPANLQVVLKETKALSASPVTRANVVREVQMLKAARGSPYISQYFANFVENDNHYTVLEHIPGGDLLKTVQYCMSAKTPPDEPTLWRYLYELCQGLAFLHGRNIVHRDVKCQNVLLTHSGNIKLIDLGLATSLPRGETLRERCGTPFYMAIEMIHKQPYDHRVDVWSMGCVFYMLAQLRPAFNGQNLPQLCKSIVDDTPVPLCSKRYSVHLSTLILSMLSKERKRRPSVENLLAHPIFFSYPTFPAQLLQQPLSAIAPLYPPSAAGALAPYSSAIPAPYTMQQPQSMSVSGSASPAHQPGLPSPNTSIDPPQPPPRPVHPMPHSHALPEYPYPELPYEQAIASPDPYLPPLALQDSRHNGLSCLSPIVPLHTGRIVSSEGYFYPPQRPTSTLSPQPYTRSISSSPSASSIPVNILATPTPTHPSRALTPSEPSQPLTSRSLSSPSRPRRHNYHPNQHLFTPSRNRTSLSRPNYSGSPPKRNLVELTPDDLPPPNLPRSTDLPPYIPSRPLHIGSAHSTLSTSQGSIHLSNSQSLKRSRLMAEFPSEASGLSASSHLATVGTATPPPKYLDTVTENLAQLHPYASSPLVSPFAAAPQFTSHALSSHTPPVHSSTVHELQPQRTSSDPLCDKAATWLGMRGSSRPTSTPRPVLIDACVSSTSLGSSPSATAFTGKAPHVAYGVGQFADKASNSHSRGSPTSTGLPRSADFHYSVGSSSAKPNMGSPPRRKRGTRAGGWLGGGLAMITRSKARAAREGGR